MLSAPALVIFVLALMAFGLFATLAIGIGINAMRLVKSGMAFANEISPQVAALAEEGQRAAERAQRLQTTLEGLRR